jgi:hypothetical protein
LSKKPRFFAQRVLGGAGVPIQRLGKKNAARMRGVL